MEAALQHVKERHPKSPGLLEVRARKNLANPANKNYMLGFAMQFIDEIHMRAYFQAPQRDHEAVGEELRRICSYIDIPY